MAEGSWVAERVRFEQVVVEAMDREGDPGLAGLDDEALVAEFRVQASEIAAAQCRWLQLLAEIVVRRIWAREGARTPTEWLSWAVSMAGSTAREQVRVALRLAEFPQLTERFAAGEISYTKVRAITRWGDPAIQDVLLKYAEHATGSQLETILRGFDRSRRAMDELDGQLSPWARRQLRAEQLDAQTMRATLELPTDLMLRLLAIADRWADAARTADYQAAKAAAQADGEPDRPLDLEPPVAYRADAIVAALEALAANATLDTSGLERHTLVLHLDADELDAAEAQAATRAQPAAQDEPTDDVHDTDEVQDTDETRATADEAASADAVNAAVVGATQAQATIDIEGGQDTEAAPSTADPNQPAPVVDLAELLARRGQTPVRVRPAGRRATAMPLSAVERLLCTAASVVAVHDGQGDVVGISGKNRQVPARLLRALHARDGGRCRFPSCTQTRWVQAHHIIWRSDDGPTVLENLVLVCARHHHLIHDHGWEVITDGHGHFRFQPPDAEQPLPTVVALPGASAEAATARNRTQGIEPAHPKALQPDWDGTRPDHDACINILYQELQRLAPPEGLAA